MPTLAFHLQPRTACNAALSVTPHRTPCNATPPAKSKMAIRVLKYGQQGLESGIVLGYWALWTILLNKFLIWAAVLWEKFVMEKIMVTSWGWAVPSSSLARSCSWNWSWIWSWSWSLSLLARVGGGGWTKTKLMLFSTQVEVVVELKL